VGELFVGGAGVALGYLNRPELTAEKFIANPSNPAAVGKVYRTGDRVRLRGDGNIEFLGRFDRQVKINGKRVELDEIEARIRATGLVEDAAVVCPPDEVGRRQIIAFVTAAHTTAVDVGRLRELLREELPDFMIPATIYCLDALPLSSTGKVDRARLPTLLAAPTEPADPPPATATEVTLREIWSRVLRTKAFGVDDNFFDLGGTSLGLMEVHASIKRSMKSDITVVEMFQYPRISALAERLTSVAPTRAPTSSAQDRARRQRAALAQRRPPGDRKG
jgi:hypothetical protein